MNVDGFYFCASLTLASFVSCRGARGMCLFVYWLLVGNWLGYSLLANAAILMLTINQVLGSAIIGYYGALKLGASILP